MSFAAVVVELDANDADRLSDALLSVGALSVDLSDARYGTPGERPLYDEPGEESRWTRVQITALFHADTDAGRRLREVCDAYSLPTPPQELRSMDDDDWVRRSQSQFAPVRVSNRLW